MTDYKELLELAAKAMGYKYMRGALWDGRDVVEYEWHPQDDDGQALRMAVKLDISIVQDYDNEGIDYAIAEFWLPDRREIEEPHGSDMYAANRKVIVQAAAEIGKAMK